MQKFPDMKALADYVHGKGLKIGIYSSPGPKTCAGLCRAASATRSRTRATWADWGIDYLKYDWCSYGSIAAAISRSPICRSPTRDARTRSTSVDRDIVYSLCQYGMGNVWEWGADVGGNCWRTTGDITDMWRTCRQSDFVRPVARMVASPATGTIPDMLVVGKRRLGPNVHDTRLTPNEQITHITLWCLLAAPLLIGGDMAQFDPWTRI